MAKKKTGKKTTKKAGKKKASRKAGGKKATGRMGGKKTAKKTAKKGAKKKTAKKKARRTVMYSSGGKKLYAKRDAEGQFTDIQQYSRAHAMDVQRSSQDERAAELSGGGGGGMGAGM